MSLKVLQMKWKVQLFPEILFFLFFRLCFPGKRHRGFSHFGNSSLYYWDTLHNSGACHCHNESLKWQLCQTRKDLAVSQMGWAGTTTIYGCCSHPWKFKLQQHDSAHKPIRPAKLEFKLPFPCGFYFLLFLVICPVFINPHPILGPIITGTCRPKFSVAKGNIC